MGTCLNDVFAERVGAWADWRAVGRRGRAVRIGGTRRFDVVDDRVLRWQAGHAYRTRSSRCVRDGRRRGPTRNNHSLKPGRHPRERSGLTVLLRRSRLGSVSELLTLAQPEIIVHLNHKRNQ